MKSAPFARVALALTLTTASLFACGGPEQDLDESGDAIVLGPIALSRIAYRYGSDVHSIASDGSGDTTYTAGSHPSYSQGRTRMAFADGGAIKVVASPFDAAAFAAATTVYSGSGSWAGVDPSMSLDGNKVVFASAGSAGFGATLFVYTLGTHNPVTLVDGSNTWVFSPTFTDAAGTRVAYTTGTPSNTNGLSIRRVSATAVNVPAASGTLLVSGGYKPAFSPDGTQLAFHRWVSGSGYDIFIADASGANASAWAGNSDYDDQDVTFSPGGSSIAFVSKRDYWSCAGRLCFHGNTGHVGRNLWKGTVSASSLDNLTGNSSGFVTVMDPSWR